MTTKLRAASFQDNAVTTAKIAADAITNAKIADDAVQTENVASTVNLGRRNIIINGAMQVAQRGTSFTSVTASAYHLDRFQYNLVGTVGASTITQNTVTDLPGFTKSLKVDVTTADASLAVSDRLALCYKIEGQDLQQVAKGTSSAKQLTLSFYIKATKTGTQIVELFDHDNTRHCAKSVTINSSDTWEFKTITYPADTTGAFDNDNANSLSIFFGLAVGTNFTTGTLATAWAANSNTNRFVGQVNHFDNTNNNFEITGVQLEVGEQVTPFEHRSFAEELALCHRYFHRANTVSVAATLGAGVWYATNQVLGDYRFPRMRTTPSASVPATNSLKMYKSGAAIQANDSTPIDNASADGFARFNITPSSNGTAGQGTVIQLVSTSDYLDMDAEL